jgi:hypothetical protein
MSLRIHISCAHPCIKNIYANYRAGFLTGQKNEFLLIKNRAFHDVILRAIDIRHVMIYYGKQKDSRKSEFTKSQIIIQGFVIVLFLVETSWV